MSRIEHKYFLFWLFYITLVVFTIFTSYYLGYLDIALSGDSTYISHGIMALYLLLEVCMGFKIYSLNKEVNDILYARYSMDPAGSADFPKYKSNLLNELISDLKKTKSNKKGDINSKILLDTLEEKLNTKNFASFGGEILVRAGLFGTIIGLIIAFLPFITGNNPVDNGELSADRVREIIGTLFSGASVAFFTTAFGILFGTLLIITGRLYEYAQKEIMNNLKALSETVIIPRLDSLNEKK